MGMAPNALTGRVGSRLESWKGLTGELFGEDWLLEGLFKNCPKVDELLAKSGGNNVTVQSNVVTLTTEQDVYSGRINLAVSTVRKSKRMKKIVQTSRR